MVIFLITRIGTEGDNNNNISRATQQVGSGEDDVYAALPLTYKGGTEGDSAISGEIVWKDKIVNQVSVNWCAFHPVQDDKKELQLKPDDCCFPETISLLFWKSK